MNGRAVLVGAGMLATVVGVAGVAAADGGSPRSARSERRSFDVPPVDPAVKARAEAVNVARWVEAVNVARWVEAVNTQRFYEAVSVRLEAERQAAAAKRRAPTRSSGGSGGDVLSCIRHRESRGQYGAVNTSSGAAGAYQFMPRTWDNTARAVGRLDLVGVNPANASAADQDMMARHLLSWQGLGPWGGGGG